MGKQQDREKIVQEIKIAADLYRKHLVGKRFLYVFEGRYFLHRSTLFHCVSVKLSISDRLQCWLAQKALCWKRLLQIRELISLAQQILILLYA